MVVLTISLQQHGEHGPAALSTLETLGSDGVKGKLSWPPADCLTHLVSRKRTTVVIPPVGSAQWFSELQYNTICREQETEEEEEQVGGGEIEEHSQFHAFAQNNPFVALCLVSENE